MSTHRGLDTHDPLRSGLWEDEYEDVVAVDRVRYQDLSNQLRTHWRHLLDPELLRGMQNAYTNQRGVPNTINGEPNPYLAYPRIPGLDLQYVDAQTFPRYYDEHGQIFVGNVRTRDTRQDGVNPFRASQDRHMVPLRSRRTRRDRNRPMEYIDMYSYLGSGLHTNIRPPRGRENISPDDTEF